MLAHRKSRAQEVRREWRSEHHTRAAALTQSLASVSAQRSCKCGCKRRCAYPQYQWPAQARLQKDTSLANKSRRTGLQPDRGRPSKQH